MSPVIKIQRRMMTLGRVRLGEKGPKGEPRKLSTFRFTSASRTLLEAVAEQHGGTVSEWTGAPDEGYFEVTTNATRLDIVLPPTFSEEDGSPTVAYSQWYELWSGGGCQRRCDGATETLSGKPCMCDPVKRQAGDRASCKITTRVSFMLPDVPGLGVWRIDSHGWNAAVELPGTLEVLAQAASEMKFIPAVLALQNRTSKQDGQTRRFVVPVIELPGVTIGQLTSGDVPLALNAPRAASRERPALPAAPAPPEDNGFEHGGAGFGERPPLPALTDSSDGRADSQAGPVEPVRDAGLPDGGSDDQAPGMGARTPEPTITSAQAKHLNVLVGKLRDGGHITTDQLWRAGGLDPADGTDEEGVCHWSPLRDRLSKEQASALIERLVTLEERVAQPAFEIPAGARGAAA